MKNYILFLLLLVSCNSKKESENVKEFLDFTDKLSTEFIYKEEKKAILDCIRSEYISAVDTLTTDYNKVLFYENVLNELYDSHIHLNVNTGQSYRLSAPVYVKYIEGKYIIKNVFSSQLVNTLDENIIGAEILEFNGIRFSKTIEDFPTKCHQKNQSEVKEWLANKIVAGQLHRPRVLDLRLQNNSTIKLDLDQLNYKESNSVLDYSVENNIGVIRINNSLGDSRLVDSLDLALLHLMQTDALILDLRNTPSGGNTDVAEPILGRFISTTQGYQKCESIKRKYIKEVSPRKETYKKPLYVLVGRWTGSMGEGMTIGLDGMGRGIVVGTEMSRLAGGIKTIDFLNSKFGFTVSIEKMYHLNGRLREEFVPSEYVDQKSSKEDEFMLYTKKLIQSSLNGED
ncbi:S41 family peptidase [Flammeovirga sp. SJP92]|uniref:S41 family peptidase n=1 Tax=Flammeovirga sp. SJP92 TaxID=1775430 RepID=UPI000789216D|nr:S41 family peptidase [Flammeovirga sp. SJP92]KXX71133.1 hypothetical protein AVL50_09890 [Flammeovirga sp. SJP92]